MLIKSLIRTIPHYPKQGIMFRDITTLLNSPIGFKRAIHELATRYHLSKVDKIVAIESRGFIFGAALAFELGVGFIPIRKKGKLPGEKIGQDYALEYGMDRIEIHVDALAKNEKVILIDDLIATGGTVSAAVSLLTRMEANILECCFIIDLPDLGGRSKIEAQGYNVFALCEFEGD